MFWGMLEIGVAMVAACLPVLRPILRGYSPQAVFESLRSFLSLQSSANDNGPIFRVGNRPHSSDSQASITRAVKSDAWNNLTSLRTVNLEAFAMGRLNVDEEQLVRNGQGGIWKNTEIKQTSQTIKEY
jgi:hypothetical protein